MALPGAGALLDEGDRLGDRLADERKNAGSKKAAMTLAANMMPNLDQHPAILVPKMRRFSTEDILAPRSPRC